MANRKWMAVAAMLLMVAAAVHAQFGPRRAGPSVKGVWSPQVGQGAAYEVASSEGKAEMEFAVVGTEIVGGKPAHWLEMAATDPRMGQMVMKTLMLMDKDKLETKRMIMQVPGQPPMEFPMSMMARMSPGGDLGSSDIRNDAEVVGQEEITTPAGTFKCTHYRAKDKSYDVWVSEKVAPYGLVKMNSKDGTVTLIRVVTNAQTKIRGTPRMMDMGVPPQ